MVLECEFFKSEEAVNCSGKIYDEQEKSLSYLDTWFWIYLGIYAALVLVAGLMSGLTMGLLSLDMMSLKVIREGGTIKQQKQARKILPIVRRHHLLLVTLLLANATAVESMPLFLDRISDPVTAICVSVTAVLFFGEVLPQALCTRYGLAIGATLTPLVYVLMTLLFPISWPISKLLDCLLGEEHTTFYRRSELKALVTLHAEPSDVSGAGVSDDMQGEDGATLTVDEVLIIKGALDMKAKSVRCAMIPIESAFMMDSTSAVLDRPTMDKLLEVAHSRIPLYERDRNNVRGILLVKTLIRYNPDESTPFTDLVHNPGCCKIPFFVREDLPLMDMLNEFQTGKCHMAIVTRRRSDDKLLQHDELIGLITLEDVMEELLQEEIIDETDVYVDVHRRIRVAKARAVRQHSRSDAVADVGAVTLEQQTVENEVANDFANGDENEPLLVIA